MVPAASTTTGASLTSASSAAKPAGTSPISIRASAGPGSLGRRVRITRALRRCGSDRRCVQRRQRENERGLVSPSPVGEAMVNEVNPSPVGAEPGDRAPVLDEDAAVALARHARERGQVVRVHGRGVEAAALGGDGEVDGLVDVAHAGEGEHGHHLLGPHQRVVVGHLDEDAAHLGAGGDAELLQDERRVLPDELAVDHGVAARAGVLLEDDLLEPGQVARLELDGARALHRDLERVGHGVDDDGLLLVDADDVVVERVAEDDVAPRLLDVRRGVDDRGRVAGAGADGALAASSSRPAPRRGRR